MIRVMGIDPGLAATGFGIVRGTGIRVHDYSSGVIHTSAKEVLSHRLEQIHSRLRGIMEEERPDLIVVEDAFSLQQNPKSGILLGKVCGVILLAGCQSGVPVKEIAVREVKQALTGNGNADKKQLAEAVQHLLNAKEAVKPSHVSDAVALAMVGLFRYGNQVSGFRFQVSG